MKYDKIYLIKFCGGEFGEYYDSIIFSTTKKSTATKYCARFNRILKKWKQHYSQFETDEMGFIWIKEEFFEQKFSRWHSLQRIKYCYYEEISIR